MIFLLMEKGAHLIEQLIVFRGLFLECIKLPLFLDFLELFQDPTSPFYLLLINFRIAFLLRRLMRFLRLLQLL